MGSDSYIEGLTVTLKVRHGLVLKEQHWHWGWKKGQQKSRRPITAEEYQISWLKYGSRQSNTY